MLDSEQQLYTRYAATLNRYILLKCGDLELSADLTQECFARLLVQMRHEPVETPLAYLYTIAKRLLIDHRRSHGVSRTEYVEPELLHGHHDPHPGPDLSAEAQIRMERLHRALEQLPTRTRHIFQLCRVEGRSHEETAAYLGVSTSAVQKHLASAMAYIIQKLGEPI